MEMQPKLLRVLQEREIVQITRISPESPDSPKFTSFHGFTIGGDSCCRFVFKRLESGAQFALETSVEMVVNNHDNGHRRVRKSTYMAYRIDRTVGEERVVLRISGRITG